MESRISPILASIPVCSFKKFQFQVPVPVPLPVPLSGRELEVELTIFSYKGRELELGTELVSSTQSSTFYETKGGTKVNFRPAARRRPRKILENAWRVFNIDSCFDTLPGVVFYFACSA